MRLISIFSFIFVGACSSIPIDGSERIRITNNQSVIKDCKYIGMVKGVDRFNGGTLGQGIAEDNARVLIRNDAFLVGADTILLTSTSTNTGGSLIEGEGYQCVNLSSGQGEWGGWDQ